MIKFILLPALALLLMVEPVLAQSKARAKSGRQQRVAPAKRVQTPAQAPRLGATPAAQLQQVMGLVRAREFDKAAPQLFILSRRPEFVSERMQIKYVLGLTLMELKLYQIAAFQFVDVVRRGDNKYVRQAIEKLSLVADILGDDTLLNYAISKVRIDEFPATQKDIVYYRLGEIKLKNNEPAEAASLFARVERGSRYYSQALFKRGLASLESNKPQDAIPAFDEMLASRAGAPVTDPTRVQALMALARAHYQARDWEKSLEYYREVPRDAELWHDAIFEATWANLRSARFRSTLSLLQSIHSAFYEDYYVPESLLVRSIVYLYICKFDETEKTLNLFEKTYQNVQDSLTRFSETIRDPTYYYAEIERAYNIRRSRAAETTGLKIPYMAARHILDQGDVKRSFYYVRSLNEERLRLDALGPQVSRSPLGVYALKVLANRYKNTKIAIGEMVKAHMVAMRTELREFMEQSGFIRYETLNGKKESLKKKIAGKEVQAIDEEKDRDFYVKNGYEYWPFDGEYWIDELGNYHYLGKQNCQ